MTAKIPPVLAAFLAAAAAAPPIHITEVSRFKGTYRVIVWHDSFFGHYGVFAPATATATIHLMAIQSHVRKDHSR
jgi:hypothetical protein